VVPSIPNQHRSNVSGVQPSIGAPELLLSKSLVAPGILVRRVRGAFQTVGTDGIPGTGKLSQMVPPMDPAASGLSDQIPVPDTKRTDSLRSAQ